MKKLVLTFIFFSCTITAKEAKKRVFFRNQTLLSQLSTLELQLQAINGSCLSWQEKLRQLNQLEERSLQDQNVFYPQLLARIAAARQIVLASPQVQLRSCRQEAGFH